MKTTAVALLLTLLGTSLALPAESSSPNVFNSNTQARDLTVRNEEGIADEALDRTTLCNILGHLPQAIGLCHSKREEAYDLSGVCHAAKSAGLNLPSDLQMICNKVLGKRDESDLRDICQGAKAAGLDLPPNLQKICNKVLGKRDENDVKALCDQAKHNGVQLPPFLQALCRSPATKRDSDEPINICTFAKEKGLKLPSEVEKLCDEATD